MPTFYLQTQWVNLVPANTFESTNKWIYKKFWKQMNKQNSAILSMFIWIISFHKRKIQVMNRTKGLKNKVGCETCNKLFKKLLYENLLEIQFHINNLDERTLQKRMRETFNVDIRWEIFKWDKRIKLDKHLVVFVKMIKLESEMSYYFDSGETQTCCNNKKSWKGSWDIHRLLVLWATIQSFIFIATQKRISLWKSKSSLSFDRKLLGYCSFWK